MVCWSAGSYAGCFVHVLWAAIEGSRPERKSLHNRVSSHSMHVHHTPLASGGRVQHAAPRPPTGPLVCAPPMPPQRYVQSSACNPKHSSLPHLQLTRPPRPWLQEYRPAVWRAVMENVLRSGDLEGGGAVLLQAASPTEKQPELHLLAESLGLRM
jgi:hypothetical protein